MLLHKTPRSRRGLTLVELVVAVAVAAMTVSLAVPALSTSREQARRQQCAINQKKIIKAYALWAQDHGGFWPPRCAPDDGCTLAKNVWILVDGPNGPVAWQKGTAYYDGARNRGLKLVGVPATEGSQEDPVLDDYPLNQYVIPGWQFGDPFEVTHCPSDAGTILTTDQMDEANLARRGLSVGQVASLYEAFGTSYLTNLTNWLPWRGHGDWAGAIGSVINKMEGPNFNPDLVYRPGAYVAGLDLGAVHPHWNKLVGSFTGENLGDRMVGAKWHENAVPADQIPLWLNANAYHADGHVTFTKRDELQNGGIIIPVVNSQCFITAEWSMFPLKLPNQLMQQQTACTPP